MKDYETCLKLKVLGLNQNRQTGSLYFLTPDFLLNIEDIGQIKAPTGMYVDVTPFVYVPTLEDLFNFLGKDFGEVRIMNDVTDFHKRVCAYARAPLGTSNETVRAFGAYIWESLANLAIAVKTYEEKPASVQE